VSHDQNELSTPRESGAFGAAGAPGETDEHLTLREPFPATGEAFSVPIGESFSAAREATSGQQGQRRGFGDAADPVSILVGLVFFLFGGAYLLASGGHLTVNAGWALSFLLLGLGLSGLLGSYVRSRRGRRARSGHDDWS
jgi:hypothetical protein